MEKSRFRIAATQLRDGLPPERRAAAAPAIRDRVLGVFAAGAGLVAARAAVSFYWPMRSEADPRTLAEALAARGHQLCLPIVVTRHAPLLFRRWRPGDALVSGGFGTQIPPASAAEIRPTILLVSLLAFDRRGYRLGYGGGFYDRTLSELRRIGTVTAIGLAFAEQEIGEVPAGPGDARLDLVATDRELIRFGNDIKG